MKIDFERAYDCLDWGFLDFAMAKIGFGERWRKWIRSCISTVNLSILVNGSPTREFSMKRGLRQGCPLSPMLFNIAAEVFSVLCRKANAVDLFKGIPIGENSLVISHLQFADDTLVFVQPEVNALLNLKTFLYCFELISGLKINYAKSSFINIGLDQVVGPDWIKEHLCNVGKLPFKYLGMPLGINPNDKSLWTPVLENIRLRLSGWKTQYLSIGGRVTLIKSMIASLPNFFLSLFKLPKGIQSEIEKMIGGFL